MINTIVKPYGYKVTDEYGDKIGEIVIHWNEHLFTSKRDVFLNAEQCKLISITLDSLNND